MALIEQSLVTENGLLLVTENGLEIAVMAAEAALGHGGASKAYAKRVRRALERREKFEEERAARYDALVNARPELKPAPETVAMLEQVLAEPIDREFENDGEEEELLLLLLAS
jgi:hypothetical protein